MALREEYHVVADMYPVNPAVNPNIVEGMFVKLDTNGYAVLADANDPVVIGVAGDSTKKVASTDGYKNAGEDEFLVINAQGKKVKTVVRASDPDGDETAASGKITVYNQGGKFHTDIFEDEEFAYGDALYVSASGKLTKTNGGGQLVGVCVVPPRAYPSGVPGTDTVDGSISLGSYMTFILRV